MAPGHAEWPKPEDRERYGEDLALLDRLIAKATKAQIILALQQAGIPANPRERKDDLARLAILVQMDRWWPIQVVA